MPVVVPGLELLHAPNDSARTTNPVFNESLESFETLVSIL
jgi:hypothetical protein